MKLNLVFIHGAGGNHTVWTFQRRAFKDAIFIDLPGHGVGEEGKRTIEEYVEYVKDFCDKRGLKNIVMIGHSMGGAITQKFALMYPEYLKGIVLVCTGARLRVAPIVFEVIRKSYAEAVKLIIELSFSAKASTELKEKAAKQLEKIKPEVLYGDFEACDKFDVMNQLKDIRVPTLIICGSEDQLTPVKFSEYLRDNIPNSRLEVIADAGHMVMLEKPEEFNEKIRRFIMGLGES